MPPYKRRSKLNYHSIVLYFLGAVIIASISIWIYMQSMSFRGDIQYSLNNIIDQSTQRNLTGYWNHRKIIIRQKHEISRLRAELDYVKTQNNIYRDTISQKQKLEQILSIKQSRYTNAIGTRVISRSPSSWYKYIVIDRGSNDGIQTGMVVISSRGVVGQIGTVYKDKAIVNLLYSKRIQFGGQILRNGIMGIIEASHRYGYANLQYIPIGSDVQKGDIIRTANINVNGLNRVYPSSYPIGQVIHVHNNRNNTQINITVKLFENYSKLDYLLVLR